jgi:integration host factor subunit beta
MLTKLALVDEIKETYTNITKADLIGIVDLVFNTFQEELAEDGGAVRLPGIGTLKTRVQPARSARNPQTGETMQVPERLTVKFKMSIGLKEEFKARG